MGTRPKALPGNARLENAHLNIYVYKVHALIKFNWHFFCLIHPLCKSLYGFITLYNIVYKVDFITKCVLNS